MLKITICIPTRNRADFAINAVNSILNSKIGFVNILLSDNSTEEGERRKLLEFSENVIVNWKNFVYVTPKNLNMTEHWDWMVKVAIDKFPETTHFSILTDRMVFKKKALSEIISLIEAYPDKLISYNHDRLNDLKKPFKFEYHNYSDSLLEINCEKFLKIVSECILHPSFPRMLNSIVPKFILEDFIKRYGTIFSSFSPDFNFAYRYLSNYQSFYYFDKTLIYHYGIYRSNGASTSRGEKTKDHEDFLKNLKGFSPTELAPIPEVITANNAVISEYFYAKTETNSKKFPEINIKKYSYFILREVLNFKNKEKQKNMKLILKNKYGIKNNIVKLYIKKYAFLIKNITQIIYIFDKFLKGYILQKQKKFFNLSSVFAYLDEIPYLRKSKITPILLTVGKIIKD